VQNEEAVGEQLCLLVGVESPLGEGTTLMPAQSQQIPFIHLQPVIQGNQQTDVTKTLHSSTARHARQPGGLIPNGTR
jgi:hypothetical protein